EAGCLRSAHDCADGGLAVALAECCITGPRRLGAAVALGPAARLDALLFGEAPSRIVVSLDPAEWPRFERIVREWAVPVARIGRVGGEALVIRVGERPAVALGVDALAEAFEGTMERLVGTPSPASEEDAA